MFRRRKQQDDSVDPDGRDAHVQDDGPEEQDGPGADGAAGASTGDALAPGPAPRPRGPWDVADAPDDDVNRIDLGGLRVPVPADTEVRVDVSPEGAVVAATLVHGDSALQVNAFAAPRSYGIWSEVREEIATSLRAGGGQAQETEGSFGTELAAGVPTDDGQLAPARFVGVDGPRWFVRGLLTGSAAVDPAAGAPLEAALRDVVVVRGGEAMAVRDPLPLALPAEVAEQVEAAEESPADGTTPGEPAADGTVADLSLPERGPEITERR